MVEITFVPLTSWPKKETAARISGRFKTSYPATLAHLKRELKLLHASRAVVQLWLELSQIKKDGTPYTDARPSSPGVVLSFTGRHGALSFACDTFRDWKDNLRAISLTLEHLRTVDRYGTTKGEQYTGWRQLPAAPESLNPSDTKAAAALLLAHAGSDSRSLTRANFASTWRAAVQRTHPDKPGGNRANFEAVMQAKQIIETNMHW